MQFAFAWAHTLGAARAHGKLANLVLLDRAVAHSGPTMADLRAPGSWRKLLGRCTWLPGRDNRMHCPCRNKVRSSYQQECCSLVYFLFRNTVALQT